MKFKKLLLSLFLVFSFLLTACGNTQNTEKTSTSSNKLKDVEILNVGTIREFNTANFSGDLMQYLGFENFCFSNPIRITNDYKVVPSFAESYTVSDDNKSIIFTIPTNAKWHDGQPVTAEDFKFSIDYCLNVLKTMKTYFKSCEIIDNKTVKVNLVNTSPIVALRQWTLCNRTVLLPKHIWENVSDPKTYQGEGSMVGCGPYKFDHYDKDAKIAYFDAFEDYHLGKPSVKRIAFKLYENKESVLMALKNKEIDCFYQYSSGFTGQYANAINNLEGYDSGLVEDMGVPVLTFNMKDDKRIDLKVREAIYYSLDYKLLASTLGQGYADIAGKGIVSPSNIGYDSSLPINEQNIKKANELLDNAGYKDINNDGFRETPDGKEFKQLITPQQSQSLGNMYDRLSQIIVKDLKNIGINAYIDEEVIGNNEKYKNRIKSNEFDIHLLSTTSGANFIDTPFKYFPTERTGYFGGTLSDPEFLKLYSGLLDSTNMNEYEDYVKKLQNYAVKNIPCIALGWDKLFFPYNTEKFEGWIMKNGVGALNYESLFNLKEIE